MKNGCREGKCFHVRISTVNRFKQLLLESAAVTEVDLFLELKQNICWFDLKGVSFVKPRTINLFSFKYIYNICRMIDSISHVLSSQQSWVQELIDVWDLKKDEESSIYFLVSELALYLFSTIYVTLQYL